MGLLMGVALVCGLVFPGFGKAPDVTAAILLALMMGVSYSKVSLAELGDIPVREALFFYSARFVVYPFILYALCHFFLPGFTPAVLLLALLPAALSAGPMAAILGGNASLALAGTLISNLVAPFVIPLAFSAIGFHVALDISGMFMALLAIIFIPAIVYFGAVRHIKGARRALQHNAGFIAVILFVIFVAVVIAQLREEILSNLTLIAYALPVLGAIFASFYILPWLLTRTRMRAMRISYTLLSGCNNMGLGVSLALLYFPERERVYIIVCEVLWIILLAGFQRFLIMRKNKNILAS